MNSMEKAESKIIYSGENVIEVAGEKALKRGPKGTVEMPYYPERDVEAIAGEFDERSAWRLIGDIAAQASPEKAKIAPSHILIDGNGFHLSEWAQGEDARYIAPEGYDPVWALGATVFTLMMGCPPFQGRGGRGQSAASPIPTLHKDMPELSRVVGRSLSFHKASRPDLEALVAIARENLSRWANYVDARPLKSGVATTPDSLLSGWPEDFEV